MGVPFLDARAGQRPIKVPVVQRRDYKLFAEYHPDQSGREMWIHCDVYRWAPSVARAISSDFKTFLEAYGAPVFAMSSPVDSKHQHWLRMHGFKFHSRKIAADNCTYEQWVCEPTKVLQ